MAGAGLGALIQGFLEADGFTVERPAAHCFAGERRTAAGDIERRFVWFSDPDAGIRPEPSALLADFAEAKGVLGASALGFYVTPTTAGLPTEFRQTANAAGIGIRVPVQFFDTAYKSESGQAFGAGQSGPVASRIVRSRKQGSEIAAMRVPQPYDTLSSLGARAGGFGEGLDLYDRLAAELTAPASGPRLTIVLGHAGAGKTFLVTALFAALQSRFLAEKNAQRTATRPVLLEPGMVRSRLKRNVDELLASVAETEVVAGATSPQLMRFLNRAGFTTWIFDGLDEFFAGEGDFIGELEDCLAAESRSQVLLVARDSLMTSSSALRGLVDRHIGSGAVRLYELSPWQRPSQRALAFLRKTGALPAEGAKDPPAVAEFMGLLEKNPAARELASLPFYCDLLLGIEPGRRAALRDPFELLALVVDGLIDREAAKLESGELGFRWDVFSGAETFVEMAELVEEIGHHRYDNPAERTRLLQALEAVGRDRLVELVEAIAHRMRMNEPYPNERSALSTEEIEDLANFYLDVGLDEALEPRVLLALVQFAFFGPGDEAGTVCFAHEIVADFLAARQAMRMIRNAALAPEAIGQALGVRKDLDRTIVPDYLARELAKEPELAEVVRAQIEGGRARERAPEGVRHLLEAMRRIGI